MSRRRGTDIGEDEGEGEMDRLTKKINRIELLRDLSSHQKMVYKSTMLALNIHGGAMFGVCGMLFAINFLVAAISPNRTPWSLFVIVSWGGVVLLHYMISYSIFIFYDLPTDELDVYWKRFIKEWNNRILPVISDISTGSLLPGGKTTSKAWKFLQSRINF